MTSKPSALIDTRVIYCGDNLDQLRKLPPGCVDLIYIDPPFNSNRNYEVFWGETKEKRSFEDRHESTKAYIDYMRPRCVELHRVLKKMGSFYYHCDWHASHYVKVMLDQIFGDDQFQSEIIWQRSYSHGNVSRSFGNICDSIFFYAKSKSYTWNQLYVPYNEVHLTREFRRMDETGRRFTLSDLRNPGVRPNLRYDYAASNGVTYKPHPNGWAVSKEVMERYDREGRLYFPKVASGGRLRLKRYLDETKGQHMQNLWTDIPALHPMSKERLGYPTQKPLELLERLVNASSNENDIVLDAFCGCGTALVAAQKLKRQWVGIDISPTACRVMAKRLKKDCGLKEDEALWAAGRGFVVRDLPKSAEELRKYPPFEFENWAVVALGGIPNKAQVGDLGIDGRIYPVGAMPAARSRETPEMEFMDVWYPVQVKQRDKVGRPDIDSFEAVMMREDRKLGYFVGFDFTSDALFEIDRFRRKEGREIKPLTVAEILNEEIQQKSA
jgi:site-specific DNA-methyltransferase (adenine-specific)